MGEDYIDQLRKAAASKGESSPRTTSRNSESKLKNTLVENTTPIMMLSPAYKKKVIGKDDILESLAPPKV